MMNGIRIWNDQNRASIELYHAVLVGGKHVKHEKKKKKLESASALNIFLSSNILAKFNLNRNHGQIKTLDKEI